MSFAAVLAQFQQLENPFPGLRPFETSEAHLFFGRDQQIAELVSRLDQHRFVAVIGLSGCGKSSLVKAGLIPALRRGPIAAAKARWRIVVMRPAGAPFASLASELEKQGLDSRGLRQSSYGLVDVARQLAPDESLLLIVDQFEELFRYKERQALTPETKRQRGDSASQTAEFVHLLLTASLHLPPIFIILTMRSDYLGDCAEFRDLPEKLNDSQYLVPRLTREQRQETIEGPLGKTEIAPSLLQRILNDAGDEPDQLPVLQHALMRTWEAWRQADPGHTRHIELADYEAAGGFENALNQHADELLEGVDEEIAERIFKRLTIRGFDNRERRDPATLADLWAVNGAEIPEAKRKIREVIDHFRQGSATFLFPRAEQVPELAPGDYLDITHESLIRQWAKLRLWLNEESEWRAKFLAIVGDAHLWEDRAGNLWRDPELQSALNWWQAADPSPAWAQRYSAKTDNRDFESARTFLEQSRRERDEEKRRAHARRRRALALMVSLSLAFAVIAVIFFVLTLKMQQANRRSVARQLAAESVYDGNSPVNLEESILLAAQSVRYEPDEWNTYMLEEGLSVLLNPLTKLQTKDPIMTVAFSPDGRYVAAGGWDRKIRLSTKDGKEVWHADGKGVVRSVAFTRDGRYLAAGADDGTVRILAVESGKELWRGKHADVVWSVSFSPDGRYIAAASGDSTASITDWQDPQPRRIFLKHRGAVQTIAFSPDGKHVLTGSTDKHAHFFNLDGSELPGWDFGGTVSTVAFSPHGDYVAAGSDDGTAQVFDAATGRKLWRIVQEKAVNSVAFSPDGRFLATAGADRYARVYDISRTRPTPKDSDPPQPPEISHLMHGDAVTAVTFSPNSRYVLTASNDTTARLFDALTGREITRHAHALGTFAIAFTGDGQYVATGGGDGVAISSITDPSEITAVGESEGETFSQMNISVSGRYVATLSANGALRVLDLVRQQMLCGPVVTPRKGQPDSIAISNDGKLVAVSRQYALALYDTQDHSWRSEDYSSINSIDMTPDGKYIAVARASNNVDVIDTNTGKAIWTKPVKAGLQFVAFSPHGDLLAAGGTEESIKVFHTSSGQQLGSDIPFKFDAGCGERHFNECEVKSLAFSFDEKFLAAGSNDRTVRVFDLQENRKVEEYVQPSEVVNVAFSRDGRYLATGNNDLTGRITERSTDRLVTKLPLQSDEFFPLGFTDQDRYILTATTNGSVRILRRLWRPNDLADEACARLKNREFSAEEWGQIASGNPPQTCPVASNRN